MPRLVLEDPTDDDEDLDELPEDEDVDEDAILAELPDDPGSKECPKTVAERVDFIAQIQSRGFYKKRTTARQLAAAWGLSKTTIEHYACEASRRVRADHDSIAEARTRALARLDHITVETLKDKDYRVAIDAIKTTISITGSAAPQRHKHEVTGADGGPIGLPGPIAALWGRMEDGDEAAEALVEAWISTGKLPHEQAADASAQTSPEATPHEHEDAGGEGAGTGSA